MGWECDGAVLRSRPRRRDKYPYAVTVNDEPGGRSLSRPASETTPSATEPAPSPVRRPLRQVASELWHQKPGPRTPKQPRVPAVPTKEIVNGLDQRERMFGFGAAFIMLSTTIADYTITRHSSVAHTRAIAGDLLLAGLVLGVLIVLGTLLRRRALLGFASFMTGFELIAGGNILGAIFLFFGGWLIVRVMRRQRQEQASGRPSQTLDEKPLRRSSAGPKSSKRYTPPRRSAPARRR